MTAPAIFPELRPLLRLVVGRGTRAVAALAMLVAITGAAPPDETAATFSDFEYVGRPLPGTPTAAPPGRYLNPVIAGSAADPSIVRVGADYYLTVSSMTFWPGLPIFRSRDLVHWTQIGSALSDPAQLRIDGLDTWKGIYAPDLKYHAGRFYLVSTCYGCGGNFIITAARPEGPWSKPRWLPFEGIDPSLYFEGGRAYVVHNDLPPGGPRWDGHRAIWLQEIDLATLTMTGPRTLLVDGGIHPSGKPFWIEGPHLMKVGARYILIAAQGGTKEAHSEVAFRADSLRGPYVARPVPILSQNGLDPARPLPVTQAGHADLVATPAGDWWAVFLASRSFGPGDLDYTAGRETFLLPVTWRDGWPEILPPGTAAPTSPARPRLAPGQGTAPGGAGNRFAENWRGSELDSRWTMLGTPARQWWRAGRGKLRMIPAPDPLGSTSQPALLGIRQADPRATVSVTVSPGKAAAGLAAYVGQSHFWAVLVVPGHGGEREVRVIRRSGARDPVVGTVMARATVPQGTPAPVRLRLTTEGPSLSFAYAVPGKGWLPVGGEQDGRTLMVSTTQHFTGTVLGVVALDPRTVGGGGRGT